MKSPAPSGGTSPSSSASGQETLRSYTPPVTSGEQIQTASIDPGEARPEASSAAGMRWPGRGRIISANSPDGPLTVQYVTDPDVDWRTCVQIRECGGIVRLHVCPDASAEHFVRALNPSIERLLAGGQWFQLWQGEIVTMDSPEASAA